MEWGEGGEESCPDSGESQTLMIGEQQSLSRSSIFTDGNSWLLMKALSCCLSRDSIPPSRLQIPDSRFQVPDPALHRAAVASRLEDVTSSSPQLPTLETGSSAAPNPPTSLVALVAGSGQWEGSAVIDVSTRDRGLTGPTDRWSGGQLMDWLPGHQHHPTIQPSHYCYNSHLPPPPRYQAIPPHFSSLTV